MAVSVGDADAAAGRPYCVVDAFTAERFAGNPAAVVLQADGLTDRHMQAVAAEFNLSETAFILPPTTADADVRLRWFTPTTEVAMCGHATIAALHVLATSDETPVFHTPDGPVRGEHVVRSPTSDAPVAGAPAACPLDVTPSGMSADPDAGSVTRIETKSGVLTALVVPRPNGDGTDRSGRTDRIIWLELAAPTLVPVTVSGFEMAEVLHVPADALDRSMPAVKTQDGDLIVFVADVRTLGDLRSERGPLIKMMRRERVRGLCVATLNTLTPSISVQSRFFAPVVGVDEDPVTGSVHGPLAVHVVKQGRVPVLDGVAGLLCVQTGAGGRAGLVRVVVQQQRRDPQPSAASSPASARGPAQGHRPGPA
ncbi:MAG: PhzF family phenazine biosynthesis protein, partial [Phycisphaerae bacterium]